MTSMYMDIIGWIGALSVLYAYFMVSTGRLRGESLHFQTANILGAFCLAVNTFYNHAYPSTVVNIIWIAIAIFSLTARNGSVPKL
ncbi:MAG TPA: hypothetical protein VNJ07_08450 [Chitinophagales bacterium]|nr:hypothetical protein [Chitinophagales bacterium]